MRYVKIENLEPGMLVGKSVYNEKGVILVNYHVALTEKLIKRMREKGLSGLYIDDELSADIKIEDLISDELMLNGDINVNLVSLRTNSDYTYKHSINVAVLSVLTGIGIGLKKSMLKELAAAALLHDIGKVNIPIEILG